MMTPRSYGLETAYSEEGFIQSILSCVYPDIRHAVEKDLRLMLEERSKRAPRPGWMLVPVIATTAMLDSVASILPRYPAHKVWEQMLSSSLSAAPDDGNEKPKRRFIRKGGIC